MTEEDMKQFIEDYKELGCVATAEKWGVKKTNVVKKVRSYAKKLGISEKELGIGKKRKYTEEEKRQIIYDYKVLDHTVAAEKWGISSGFAAYVKRFAKELGVPEEELGIKSPRVFTADEMRQFVEDYIKFGSAYVGKKWGVKNAAAYAVSFAEKIGVPIEDLGVKKYKKYTKEEMEQFIEDYINLGNADTGKKWGVVDATKYARRFARKIGVSIEDTVNTPRKFSEDDKKSVVEAYYKYGIGYTTEMYGIYPATIYKWIKGRE